MTLAMDDKKNELLQILLKKSIKTGHFILASGKESDLYCDCRVTTLDARGANLIGEVGWELVKNEILSRFPEVKAIGDDHGSRPDLTCHRDVFCG